jgi:hypothetical protein
MPSYFCAPASYAVGSRGFRHRTVPNPSIERTRTGRPRYARWSFSASRGLPARAAHVKRWAPWELSTRCSRRHE